MRCLSAFALSNYQEGGVDMSGSGRTNSWTPTPPRNPCATLTFKAQINSPQPAGLASITVGAILMIQLAPAPKTAVLALYQGQPIGSITGSSVTNLINCLLNGYLFEAEVVSIFGGSCTVNVGPA